MNIQAGDRLVDYRNHTWFVINPNKRTIRGATGSSDGRYGYYTIQDDRVIIAGEYADHYSKERAK